MADVPAGDNELDALLGGDLGDLAGGDLGDLAGDDLTDQAPAEEMADVPAGDNELDALLGGDLGDLAGGDLGDLAGGDLGDLAGGDLGDLAGGDLGDLAGGDLGDLAGGDLGDLAGGDLGDSADGDLGDSADNNDIASAEDLSSEDSDDLLESLMTDPITPTDVDETSNEETAEDIVSEQPSEIEPDLPDLEIPEIDPTSTDLPPADDNEIAPSGENAEEIENVLDQLGMEEESYSDLRELDSILGNEDVSIPDVDDSIISDLPGDTTDSLDSIDEPESLVDNSGSFSIDNLDDSLSSDGQLESLDLDDTGSDGSEDTIGVLDEDLGSLDGTDGSTDDFLQSLTDEENSIEESPVGTDLEDLSMPFDEISDLSETTAPATDSSSDDFGIDSLEEFAIDSFDAAEQLPSGEEPLISDEMSLDDIPADSGVPEELSAEDVENDRDIEINLSDDERKQIVISLSALPKEAELTIAKAIVSGKYSNMQLRPLIDALIANEAAQVVLKTYERITGDTSLNRLAGAKYTGSDFEERQKSFVYVFQKNILPILNRIAAATVLVTVLIALGAFFIVPAYRAWNDYRTGYNNLEEKIFWDVEEYFEKGFARRPRYNWVLKYADKYREYKRYLEAEKKYLLALNMRPFDHDLKLTFADFFKERGDFERASALYREMIKSNDRDLKAMTGLAGTYAEWAKSDIKMIEPARETYLDVLDIDPKNKQALFGNLDLYLREKNHPKIMTHYNYINDNLGNRIDPVVYARLADYLMERDELDDIKDILQKASSAASRQKMIMPEIDYMQAKYRKSLKVGNEERAFLQRAVNTFDRLKENDRERFESAEYQDLLARVYNDLGENYDKTASIDIRAEEYYIKSINANERYGKPYYNLGNFYLNHKNDYQQAMRYYIDAEDRGFSNDRLQYNMGWLQYKNDQYLDSYMRINGLQEKYPDNTNLKFMNGTLFYKMGRYDLAEAVLLETFNYFEDQAQRRYPLEIDLPEDKQLMHMIMKVANNLGAAYQKKYEQQGNYQNVTNATRYYSDSINYFDRLINDPVYFSENEESGNRLDYESFQKERAHHNLRGILYPDIEMPEPLLFESFPMDFQIYQ
jgi:hypothetical protein